jgi:hypothetical protein
VHPTERYWGGIDSDKTIELESKRSKEVLHLKKQVEEDRKKIMVLESKNEMLHRKLAQLKSEDAPTQKRRSSKKEDVHKSGHAEETALDMAVQAIVGLFTRLPAKSGSFDAEIAKMKSEKVTLAVANC